MTIVIDKGVPMPALGTHASKYPFGLMEVGDSFFVALDERGIDNLRSTASVSGRRHKARYLVRKVENGARVWRIE